MTDDEATAAAHRICKSQGCLCRPDITVERPDPEVPNYMHVTVAHDSWCPLYASRQAAFN